MAWLIFINILSYNIQIVKFYWVEVNCEGDFGGNGVRSLTLLNLMSYLARVVWGLFLRRVKEYGGWVEGGEVYRIVLFVEMGRAAEPRDICSIKAGKIEGGAAHRNILV